MPPFRGLGGGVEIDILDTIIANKRLEVKRQKQAVPLQTLISLGNDRIDSPVNSMRRSLETSDSGIIRSLNGNHLLKGGFIPEPVCRM